MNDNGGLADVLSVARAHIFDVDHTLLRHSTGRRFAQAGIRAGVFPRRHMLQLPWFYLRYRLGNLTVADLGREVKVLRGRSYEELVAIANDAWERHGRSDLYPKAAEYVAACGATGATTAFASTSFRLILTPIARELGIREIVASEIEFKNQIATGWIASDPCYAEVKAARVSEFLAKQGISAKETAFYSDSFHDLPLLEAVAYPVTVHPDPALRRIAHRRRWPIVNWQTTDWRSP